MAVPLIAGGIMTAGRAGLSYWAKKKLQREAAARLALETSKATAVPALTSGSTGLYAKNLAKYTAAGVGGVGVGNSIEAMTQQPNGGDLHPRVEAMDRLRNGGGMTGLEKGVPEEIHGDAYVSQDERDMINHFSRIDSMNLSQEAREMLKEDYLRNRTGAAKTVQEVGDTYPDVEIQEVDTFMGMPRGLRRRR